MVWPKGSHIAAPAKAGQAGQRLGFAGSNQSYPEATDAINAPYLSEGEMVMNQLGVAGR